MGKLLCRGLIFFLVALIGNNAIEDYRYSRTGRSYIQDWLGKGFDGDLIEIMLGRLITLFWLMVSSEENFASTQGEP